MSNPSVNGNEPQIGNQAANLSPLAVRARLAFKAMLRIFALVILIQVFLAGLALFWDAAQWTSHIGFAKWMIIVSILIFGLSFFARLPLSFRLSSAALVGIIILMAVIAKLPHEIGYLAALHPVFAVMMFFGTLSLAKETDALIQESASKAN